MFAKNLSILIFFFISFLILLNNNEFYKLISKSHIDLEIIEEYYESKKKNKVKKCTINNCLSYNNTDKIVISTDVLRITFDTMGAQIIKSEILKHLISEKNKNPFVIMDRSKDMIHIFQSGILGSKKEDKFPNHHTIFKLTSSNFDNSLEKIDIVFEAKSGNLHLIKNFIINKRKYNIYVNHNIFNYSNNKIINPSLYLQIEKDNNKPVNSSKLYKIFYGVGLYDKKEKFQKISFEDIKKGNIEHITKVDNGWISIVQHYFATVLIPTQNKIRINELTQLSENLYIIRSIENIGIMYPKDKFSIKSVIWIGPKYHDIMFKISDGLDLIIDYGFLSYPSKIIFSFLKFFHFLFKNWGWSIIFLTLLIKFLFYPLNSYSYKSIISMKKINSKLEILKSKFDNQNKKKINNSIIDLYRKENINPIKSFAPTIFQIPVFVSLYWVLLSSVEIRGSNWLLWFYDLSENDPLFILPSIMMITMFLQIRINKKQNNALQKKFIIIMPMLFGIVMFFFPSSLLIYWCMNNIVSMIQQNFILKKISKYNVK